MTIDRVPLASAPRIDKSTVVFAPGSSVEGEGNATESGQPSFSSVLETIAEAASDARDATAPDNPGTGTFASPPALVIPSDSPPDTAALLAQMAAGGVTVATAAASPGPVDGRAGVANAPLTDASAVLPGTWPQTAGAEGAARPLGAQAGGEGDLSGADTSAALAESLNSPAPAPQVLRRVTTAGMQNSATTVMQGDAQALRGADTLPGASDAGPAHGDWRAALAITADRAASLSPLAVDAAGSGFRSLPALRSTERQGVRSVFLPLDAAAPGSVASSTYASQTTFGTLAGSTAEAPMAAGASADIAQKVHYWVTRGVQNAELQLDAFGGSAVDVSISLQGKEALVEFRSDQPEARRVLQDAMPQLRDMLHHEGLQLAGGFVGTSAQQQHEGQRRAATDGATTTRTGTVLTADAAADQPRVHGPGASHALDVFV